MAQNEPQRKQTPPGPSPNSPSLLFEYQCRSSKFTRLANRIEKKIDSVARIESKLFCPNWNALLASAEGHVHTNYSTAVLNVHKICDKLPSYYGKN